MVENAQELRPNRFTLTTQLERHLADQAAEQEITGLVVVRERMEEVGDSLPRRTVLVEDRQQPGLDVGPISVRGSPRRGPPCWGSTRRTTPFGTPAASVMSLTPLAANPRARAQGSCPLQGAGGANGGVRTAVACAQ